MIPKSNTKLKKYIYIYIFTSGLKEKRESKREVVRQWRLRWWRSLVAAAGRNRERSRGWWELREEVAAGLLRSWVWWQRGGEREKHTGAERGGVEGGWVWWEREAAEKAGGFGSEARGVVGTGRDGWCGLGMLLLGRFFLFFNLFYFIDFKFFNYLKVNKFLLI